jgi:NADP-dependent 3-hydroxy acid dehydrogenase YdfG
LVTGASKGIGAAVAEALIEAGATVTDASRSSGIDLLDRSQRATLPVDVDILINCAGNQLSVVRSFGTVFSF